MSTTEVILSPHLDDAAYSCWHRITSDSIVATIFAGYPAGRSEPAPWDASTGFGSPREAIERRIQENVDALGPTNAAIVNLDFWDVEYRDNPVHPPDIVRAIGTLVGTDTQLIAPLGFSYGFQHPDHHLTREAARLLQKEGVSTSYYLDLPYAMTEGVANWPSLLPRDLITRLVGRTAELEVRELSEVEQEHKKIAVQKYASQYERNNAVSNHVFDDPEAFRWEVIAHPL